MPTILLIDDDKEILTINRQFLSKEGFHIIAATNANVALSKLHEINPDCIVMDVMMPGINGFEACKKFKTRSNTPIILLSGCSTEDNKITGLSLGADDYMVKPYSLRELSARIKVQLRKKDALSNAKTRISYPPLSLDFITHTAYYNDESISLSNREYQLLYLLLSHPDQLMTFDQIGVELFGSYLESDRKTVMVTASRLRKKLNEYIGLEDIIETVWSKGYQFKTSI